MNNISHEIVCTEVQEDSETRAMRAWLKRQAEAGTQASPQISNGTPVRDPSSQLPKPTLSQ